MDSPKVFSFDEVSKHNNSQSCWVILYDAVWDVTDFLDEHPGGVGAILNLGGQDATEEFDPIHPPGILEDNLPASARLGVIDKTTIPKKPIEDNAVSALGSGAAAPANAVAIVTPAPSRPAVTNSTNYPPPESIDDCLNLDDVEAMATQKLTRAAWAYYYSAGDDGITKRENTEAYRRILLRPRVFVDVSDCDTSTTLLGGLVSGMPVFSCPTAMARLAHPDGEHGIAVAAAKYGVVQIISNSASMTPEQIVAGADPSQSFGWQLYVQDDRVKSERMLERINNLPNIKFIALTVDAPVSGKREDDERTKGGSISKQTRAGLQFSDLSTTGAAAGVAVVATSKQRGPGKRRARGTAADLTWHTTLPWLARHTKLPIVLKGIQTHEDAYIASLCYPQVRGIILSNHGGRSADTAPPAIHTLLEIRKYCPAVFDRLDVWVDGGIRRGTDVVKALCLGAKAVGIGRPPLWGLGAAGTEGVERVFEILSTETARAMALLGATKVEELGAHHVNTRIAERDIYDGPSNLGNHLTIRPRL